MLFLSALSFLGLGVQPPDADWGGMVKENKDGIVFGIPAALIPAAAIAALAISVNLVADWVLNRTTEPQGRARLMAEPAKRKAGRCCSTSATCASRRRSIPPGEAPKNITLVHDVSLTLENAARCSA